MKISRIRYSGPTVVVLGAGATRGAQFVPRPSQILPPLDADFFTQAQRLPAGEESALMQELIHYAVRIFGPNFKLTMEGFLTQIEYLANVFADYKRRGRPPNNEYYRMRHVLLQVLACVLHQALGTEPECSYHRGLIETLDKQDTIMSFNYDCAIDHNLKLYGSGKWNARSGYGQPCHHVGARAWNPPKPAQLDETVLLLKMHGSLNWFPYPEDRTSPRLRLKERWWRQYGDVHFEIVPPEWNKQTIRRGVYKTVWRKARARLDRCRGLVFIGCSLPATDLPAHALFRVDAYRATKLRLLVIANPDPEARRRIRDILRRRITESTRVLVFESLADLHKFLSFD